MPNSASLWDFTHANITGMTRYLKDRKPDQNLTAGSELVTMLRLGADLGMDANQAYLFGWDKPQRRVNDTASPPPDGGDTDTRTSSCEGSITSPTPKRYKVEFACTHPVLTTLYQWLQGAPAPESVDSPQQGSPFLPGNDSWLMIFPTPRPTKVSITVTYGAGSQVPSSFIFVHKLKVGSAKVDEINVLDNPRR